MIVVRRGRLWLFHCVRWEIRGSEERITTIQVNKMEWNCNILVT
jgi:hypothetical protein